MAGVRNPICTCLPPLVSAFVDAFVDYVVGGVVLGCDTPFPPIPEGPFGKSSIVKDNLPPLITRLPGVRRVIAIGDIHGDLDKARWALGLAKVMNEKNEWIGGETVVVQVGDVLDRGGDELRIIYMLEKLKREAQRAGGDIHIMTGNHEVLNMEGDFRFTTESGLAEFRHWAKWYRIGATLKDQCQGTPQSQEPIKSDKVDFLLKGRLAALRPGGPIARRFLALHPVVLIVGSTLFVHAGVKQADVKYGLEKINRETRMWMLGKQGFRAPKYLGGPHSLLWTRDYPELEARHACGEVSALFERIPGVDRMVIGHTIMKYGVQLACGRKIVCIDVGMSSGCTNTLPEVLEILDDRSLSIFTTSCIKRVSVNRVYSVLYEDTEENRSLGLVAPSKKKDENSIHSIPSVKKSPESIPPENSSAPLNISSKPNLDLSSFGSLKENQVIASSPKTYNLSSQQETFHDKSQNVSDIKSNPTTIEKISSDKEMYDITASMQKLHIVDDGEKKSTDILMEDISIEVATDTSRDGPQAMDVDSVGSNKELTFDPPQKKKKQVGGLTALFRKLTVSGSEDPDSKQPPPGVWK